MSDAVMDEVAHQLMHRGPFIEGGWQLFRTVAFAPDASPAELTRGRDCYRYGAQFVLDLIVTALSDAKSVDLGAICAEVELNREAIHSRYRRANA